MSVYQSFVGLDGGANVVQRRRAAVTSRKSVRLYLYALLLAIDSASFAMALLLTSVALGTLWRPYSGVGAVLLLLPVFALFALNMGAYTMDVLHRPIEGLRRVLVSVAMAMFTMLLIAFFLQSGDVISRLTFGVEALASAGFVSAGRLLFHQRIKKMARGELSNELLILDGVPPIQGNSAVTVDAARLKLVPDANDPQMLDRFGTLTKSFDRIIVASSPENRAAWALLLKGADVDGEILVEQFNDIGAIGIRKLGDADTLLVSRRTLSVPHRAKKRFLDLLITVPLLIALLPLFVLVAIAIRLDSPGPILFKQERVGRGNCLFKVLKFRSMYVAECDAAGAQSTSRDDNRITRIGKLIRRTSIDELPQLINVLLGDMSLVGPRPHALGSLAGERLFWEIDQTYWHRHRLKPGITGLAQIRGFRGATAASSDLTNRLQADMEYIEGWEIWRDIAILIHTFRVLIHKNAY